jgi:hypothetical protein
MTEHGIIPNVAGMSNVTLISNVAMVIVIGPHVCSPDWPFTFYVSDTYSIARDYCHTNWSIK